MPKLLALALALVLASPAFAEDENMSRLIDSIDRFNDGALDEDCLDGEGVPRPRMLDEDLCRGREATFNGWAENARPLTDTRLPDSQLVLVGEAHWARGCRHYPEFFGELQKKTGFDCFAFELTDEKYKTYESGEPGTPVHCYRQAIDLLKKRGVKIHIVDRPPGPGETDADQLTVAGLNRRDEYMAKRLGDLLKNKECRKIGGLFGKFHLTPEHPDRKTLSQLLRPKHRVTTINYQNMEPHFSEMGWGFGPDPEDETWSYSNHCPMPKAQFRRLATVKTSDAPADMDLFGGQGAWRDFDYSVFSGRSTRP